MKNYILRGAIALCCLLCICGFTWDSYYTPSEPIRFDYPVCNACGGDHRKFTHIEGTSHHAVNCSDCGTLILEEDCFILLEATCDRPGSCLCDNVLEIPWEHQLTVLAMNEFTHDEVCVLPDCSCNFNSPYYTGSYRSYAHTYTPFTYQDYISTVTGKRCHSRVRYCTECGYENYDTIPCGCTNLTACPSRAACLNTQRMHINPKPGAIAPGFYFALLHHCFVFLPIPIDKTAGCGIILSEPICENQEKGILS